MLSVFIKKTWILEIKNALKQMSNFYLLVNIISFPIYQFCYPFPLFPPHLISQVLVYWLYYFFTSSIKTHFTSTLFLFNKILNKWSKSSAFKLILHNVRSGPRSLYFLTMVMLGPAVMSGPTLLAVSRWLGWLFTSGQDASLPLPSPVKDPWFEDRFHRSGQCWLSRLKKFWAPLQSYRSQVEVRGRHYQ